jgi:hypothetical protein
MFWILQYRIEPGLRFRPFYFPFFAARMLKNGLAFRGLGYGCQQFPRIGLLLAVILLF